MDNQSAIRYVTKEEAERLYKELLAKNDIPTSSRTAKCMFSKTRSTYGNQCQFGLTPLWENELRKNAEGKVLHSEFMDMARRLIDAGVTRQGRG
jgi:hypothetical protein